MQDAEGHDQHVNASAVSVKVLQVRALQSVLQCIKAGNKQAGCCVAQPAGRVQVLLHLQQTLLHETTARSVCSSGVACVGVHR